MLHGNFFNNHIKIAENIASMPKKELLLWNIKTKYMISTKH